MATTTTDTARGQAHVCPFCGEENGLSVRISDGLIQCCGCDGEWTPEELEALARRWLRLAAWARTIPGEEG